MMVSINMKLEHLCLSCLFLLLRKFVACNTTEEIRLHNDLFQADRYNTHVRPVLKRNTSVQVTFHMFHLYCIMDLDEKLQVMKSSGWLTITWQDELLTWKPSEYDETESTLLSQDLVWKPDIVINNAVDTVSKGLGFSRLAVKIFSNGTVLWEPGDVFQTLCIVDVSNFPFDTQYCIYEFSTWMYLRDDINLTVTHDSVDMRFYHENGEWEVTKTEASVFDQSYEPYAGAVYKLTLRRRRGVYILNIIVPIILLSFLNSFVFVLPAESGEKTALCVTSMLSFMVYLSSIVDMVPKTSIKMPLIVVYLVVMLTFSALSVIFTVIVLFTYQQKQSSRIPSCLQFLISCRFRLSSTNHRKSINIGKSFESTRTPMHRKSDVMMPDASDSEKEVAENGKDYRINNIKERLSSGRHHSIDYHDVEENETNKWRLIAETLDRIFFYCVFSLSTLMSCLTLLILALK